MPCPCLPRTGSSAVAGSPAEHSPAGSPEVGILPGLGTLLVKKQGSSVGDSHHIQLVAGPQRPAGIPQVRTLLVDSLLVDSLLAAEALAGSLPAKAAAIAACSGIGLPDPFGSGLGCMAAGRRATRKKWCPQVAPTAIAWSSSQHRTMSCICCQTARSSRQEGRVCCLDLCLPCGWSKKEPVAVIYASCPQAVPRNDPVITRRNMTQEIPSHCLTRRCPVSVLEYLLSAIVLSPTYRRRRNSWCRLIRSN